MPEKSRGERRLATVGLFAGIGGLELGFERAGHLSVLLVDNSPAAYEVLRTRFPDSKLESDVRDLSCLPDGVDVLVAGFPCQDLSSVGLKIGIHGERSSVVGEVFRLLRRQPVPWVVLENVPFILQLHGGRAMRMIASALGELGYSWAYRVIDSEAFGLPHRRRRWFLVASLESDPRDVLLSGSAKRPANPPWETVACGFYWTEGMRALGWAVNSLPPIKGGSSIGVPSPPAIVLPDGFVGTPDIRDAERLQGFPVDWTEPAEHVVRPGFRWQLVGNAVTVRVSRWLGRRLVKPVRYDESRDAPKGSGPWPYAGWSTGEGVYVSSASPWPVWWRRPNLAEFLRYPLRPLSARAASGFLRRTRKGSLRFPEGFLERVQHHIENQEACG
jgi:DNA (cytosine-5)-methyltransferase 1